MQAKPDTKYKAGAIVVLVACAYHSGWFLYYFFTRSRLFFFGSNMLYNLNNIVAGITSISGVAAAIFFLTGNRQAARWVKLIACIKFFIMLMSLFLLALNAGEMRMHYGIAAPWYQYALIALQCLLFGYGAWALNGLSEIAYEKLSIAGEELQSQATMADKLTRFLNRLIDYIIIIHVLTLNTYIFSSMKNNSEFYLFIIVVDLFYYLLFEGILKMSPAKIITRCMVINEDGSSPGFLKILGRSFCRLIPFDGLSFLGNDGRGWHDSIPGVYVVKEKTSDPLEISNP